ncbi:hypothetical protein EDD27_10888 [Nonomuraea polychroma]|uniref:Uncharacterized protein n=1 Tax=Nonomuraea polychroma TaxID=46176 RepID=A0A438MR90_9ACTN|nr:hypothetical protein [Nonomuraea polychroma]RVX47935.1 hypothetical protein EDD27_10888 [Nonomuraea polychroma]
MAASTGIKGVLNHLGIPRSRSAVSFTRTAVPEPAGFRPIRLSEADVRSAAEASRSVVSMMRLLNLPVTETNRRRVLRRIARYDIDTSGFDRTRQGSACHSGGTGLLAQAAPQDASSDVR